MKPTNLSQLFHKKFELEKEKEGYLLALFPMVTVTVSGFDLFFINMKLIDLSGTPVISVFLAIFLSLGLVLLFYLVFRTREIYKKLAKINSQILVELNNWNKKK